MMEVAAYSLFILMGALPSIVPVLALTLPLQAGLLAMRGYWILAIPCLLLAAYCAALAYGPPDAVPGGQALQSLRRANDSRDLALKMMRSSSFGGHGAPVTVGEIMKVHGEPAVARNAGAAQQPARRDKPEPAPEPTLRGDEPMVDPTPTM